MPEPREKPSIQRLRDLADAQVRLTSLRQVATQVGLSPTGLRKFLNGADPHSRTRGKLLSWFVRLTAAEADGLDADSAIAALTILTAGLTPENRKQVVENVVRSLESAYDAQSRPHPSWLKDIRELAARDEGKG